MLGRRILVGVESRIILPLRPLDADTTHGKQGAPDTAVGGPHHSDGNPTTDISTYQGVGLPPLGGEAAVQAFQCDLRLGTQEAVH